MIFEIEKSKLIKYNGGEKNVVIPFGITSIGESAFANSEIESVLIPNSVTTIEDCAFWGCESLKFVEIPDSVTEIGDSIFVCCKNLQKAKISPKLLFGLCMEHYDIFFGCRKLEIIN